jgi:hypothetical protein
MTARTNLPPHYVKMSIADHLYACSYPVEVPTTSPNSDSAVSSVLPIFSMGTATLISQKNFDTIVHSLL